jgi:Trk-type K+ transport system membrane component
VATFNDSASALTLIMVLLMLIGGGIGSTAGGSSNIECIPSANGHWSLRDSLSFPGTINHDRIRRPSATKRWTTGRRRACVLYRAIFIVTRTRITIIRG